MNYDEAAAFLGLSKRTLYAYVCRSLIPYFKSCTGKVLFDTEELKCWRRYKHQDAKGVLKMVAEVEAAAV